MKKLNYIFVLVLLPIFGLAQLDSIQKLDEVVLSDVKLKQYTNTQVSQVILDSIIKRTSGDLTTLINYNTPIYFKEYGLGMTSSPSFRGSTASQTAVVWNGININSQTTGQTDFNTISTRNFNQFEVRAGGGSVLYGSGAIGGTIHLKNDLSFNKGFQNEFGFNGGSFDTYNGNYKVAFSDKKLSVESGINFLKSDNDYPYVKSEEENVNGQFYNSDVMFSLAYKLDTKNTLKFYNNFFLGSRHLSLETPRDNKTKYDNFDTRSLVVWTGQYNKFTSNLRLAYLTEAYQYFEDIETDDYTGSEVKSMIAKYDLSYQLNKKITINPVIDFTQNRGEGSSIEKVKRQIAGFSLLLKHQLFKKLLYEASVRQEVTNNYKSPLLYNLGLNYNLFKRYTIKLNISKNFRIPTFNDLYWETGGNLDLLPETSQQYEMSHDVDFKWLNFGVTGYYNAIDNMIRWTPQGGLWSPVNIDEVETYGLESRLTIRKIYKNHHIALNGTYGYTISENKKLGKQLPYVPLHKFNSSLSYNYKGITVFYEHLFVGDVFSTSDHNPKFAIKEYQISNAGAEYTFKAPKQITLGFKLKNFMDFEYQTVLGRNMPGINFNTYLNIKY